MSTAGFCLRKYLGAVTCFGEPFIVEFMSDANVPVAQLDRAAAF